MPHPHPTGYILDPYKTPTPRQVCLTTEETEAQYKITGYSHRDLEAHRPGPSPTTLNHSRLCTGEAPELDVHRALGIPHRFTFISPPLSSGTSLSICSDGQASRVPAPALQWGLRRRSLLLSTGLLWHRQGVGCLSVLVRSLEMVGRRRH